MKKTAENPSFLFHPLLNQEYLVDFYNGDLEDVSWAISIFCDVTLKDFYQLLPLSQSQNWPKLVLLAHRLRPNFKLVGLTALSDKMSFIEDSDFSHLEVQQKTVQFLTKLDQRMRLVYQPMLLKELQRLKDFFQQD